LNVVSKLILDSKGAVSWADIFRVMRMRLHSKVLFIVPYIFFFFFLVCGFIRLISYLLSGDTVVSGIKSIYNSKKTDVSN